MGVEITLIGPSSAIINNNNYNIDNLCQICPARQIIPGKTHCSGISSRTNTATVTIINTDIESFSKNSAKCKPEAKQRSLV